MLKKIPLLFKKEPQCSLSDLNPLFKNVICKLPREIQIDYCERVINAAIFDLQQNVCPENGKALKNLINAAKKKIKSLDC